MRAEHFLYFTCQNQLVGKIKKNEQLHVGSTLIRDVVVMLNDVNMSHFSVFRIFWKSFFMFFPIYMRFLVVSKTKNPLFLEDGIEYLSLVITVRHHPASFTMTNGDPQDGFFYHTLRVMMDSYNPLCNIIPFQALRHLERGLI